MISLRDEFTSRRGLLPPIHPGRSESRQPRTSYFTNAVSRRNRPQLLRLQI
jgi:hypothetical protein